MFNMFMDVTEDCST